MKKKLENLKRNCPSCNDIIYYHDNGNYTKACNHNYICKRCQKIRWDRENIGQYIRYCMSCNRPIYYTRKDLYINSIKRNNICISCQKLGGKNPAKRSDVREKLRMNHFTSGRTLEEAYGLERSLKLKKSYGIIGEKNPAKRLEVRIKISKALQGKSGEHNKKYEKRSNQRIKMSNRYLNEHLKICKSFHNPKSIPIIEQYGKDNGYNFRHAENHPEGEYSILGYYVDGYDQEKNVVIEYDEKHHYTVYGELKERDVIRQKEIEQSLGCKFIRIKYDGSIIESNKYFK